MVLYPEALFSGVPLAFLKSFSMGDRRKAVKNRCSTGENTLMWVIDKCWIVWEKYFTWFWLTRKRNLLKTQ